MLFAKQVRQRRIRAGEEHNAKHPEVVAEFNRLTGGVCAGGQCGLDINKFRAWQNARGLIIDGKIGPKSIEAARKETGQAAGAADEKAAKGADPAEPDKQPTGAEPPAEAAAPAAPADAAAPTPAAEESAPRGRGRARARGRGPGEGQALSGAARHGAARTGREDGRADAADGEGV
jgi:hypothetical protein